MSCSGLGGGARVVLGALLGVLVAGGAVGCARPSPPAAPPATAATPAPVTAPPTTPTAAAPARPAGPVAISGESARIEFEPAAKRHLDSEQTEWTGLPPARNDGSSTVELPVTGGTVTLAPGVTPAGQVSTAGTAELSRADRKLDFSDLTVDFDRGEVDATLDGRRVALFHLDLTAAHREDLANLPPEIVGISGYLSDDAREELRDRLGTTLTEGTSRIDMELRLRPSP